VEEENRRLTNAIVLVSLFRQYNANNSRDDRTTRY
jgi:hypothetical protein